MSSHCESGTPCVWSAEAVPYPCSDCGHQVWQWCTVSECCGVCRGIEAPVIVEEEEREELLTGELSADTQAALAEFLATTQADETRAVELDAVTAVPSIDAFKEDWGLSQFWYSEETADYLAKALVQLAIEACPEGCGRAPRIALCSTPTLYEPVVKYYMEARGSDQLVEDGVPLIVLLEFDQRFSRYGSNFVHWDVNVPLDLKTSFGIEQAALEHQYDVLVLDPPYLAPEILTKAAETIHFLARKDNSAPCLDWALGDMRHCRVVYLSGRIMAEHARDLLQLQMSSYRPDHGRQGQGCALRNEFRAYINFSKCDSLPLDVMQLKYLQQSGTLNDEMSKYIAANPLPEGPCQEDAQPAVLGACGEV